MPATTFKILNKNSPGTSTTFAADDWDMLGRYLNDVDLSATAPSSIKTNTRYWDDRLRVWNPAKTFVYRIRSSAILADRQLNLPLLTGTDELAVLLTPQEFQLKTIDVNLNTLKNTSNSIGQLLVGNGTKYLPLNMGSTAGHVLTINSGVNGLEWAAPSGGGGGGETNTASNVGTAGVGVFKQKTGVNLEFKKINGASGGLITVVDDTAASEVDLKIAGGTDGQFLKSVGTTPTWSSLTSQYGRVMPDGSNYIGARYGSFQGGAADGEGMFGGMATEGNIVADVASSTITRTNFESVAEDTAISGIQTWTKCTNRGQSPRLKVKFSLNPSTERCWVGFLTNSSYPGGVNPVASNNGMVVGYGETDSNFVIRWNDGSVSPQTYNTGTTKSTTYQTIEMLMSSAGSVSAWWNGTQVVNANTTQVPSATGDCAIFVMAQAVGNTMTRMGIEYAMLTF